MSGERVAVVGASGFIGAAAVRALRGRRSDVTEIRAPRVHAGSDRADLVAELAERFRGLDAVVNAAGVPAAAGTDLTMLRNANAVLPGILAQACEQAVVRMVHVSSAAVQGRRPQLDNAVETDPFSPYSDSKAEGEQLIQKHGGSVVIYRPPGVHDASRSATRAIARVATSPLSSVAAPGTANTAQALVANVADAIAFLAIYPDTLPQIVHHPSEGLTTARLLVLLGQRDPRIIPARIARAMTSGAFGLGRWQRAFLGQARRLEMLWFGQDQAASWLSDVGWEAPHGHEAWRRLGAELRLIPQPPEAGANL